MRDKKREREEERQATLTPQREQEAPLRLPAAPALLRAGEILRLQRALGNRATGQLLHRSPARGVVQRAPTGKRNTRFAKNSIDPAIKKHTVAPKFLGKGRWTSTITVRGSQSFQERRAAQLLRHIAAQVYWYIKTVLGQSDEQEIQGLYINERFVLASNDYASLAAFATDLKQKADAYAAERLKLQQAKEAQEQAKAAQQQDDPSAESSAEAAPLEDAGEQTSPASQPTDELQPEHADDGTAQPTGQTQAVPMDLTDSTHPVQQLLTTTHMSDARSASNARKIRGVFSGRRAFVNNPAAATLLKAGTTANFFATVDGSNPAAFAEAVTSEAFKGRIILLQSGEAEHAEQKLVLALFKMGFKGSVSIYGKKRPCAVCCATLRFAKEKLGIDIDYNHNAGGYWSTANAGLHALIQAAIDRGILTKAAALDWLNAYAAGMQSHGTQKMHNADGARRKRRDLATEAVAFDDPATRDVALGTFESGYDSASDSEYEDD